MGLRFGWRVTEVRESIWCEDEALTRDADGKVAVPAAAMAAWRETGDATALEPYCTNGKPQIIRYRTLTLDEIEVVRAPFIDPTHVVEGYRRLLIMCFRIGVDFAGKETQGTPDAVMHDIIVKQDGIRMLAEPFVAALERSHPGLIGFYGKLIWDGSRSTDAEKKASSPPSTPTPSSAEGSTAATTEPSPSAGAA